MRTLVCCFAGIAFISGLIGRTSTMYLFEKRVASRIESLGGAAITAPVRPESIVDRIIFRCGGASLFGRIVNIRIAPSNEGPMSSPIQMTDEVAESIGGLRHLVYLRIGGGRGVNVTDPQLKMIAKCSSLTELEIVQQTPFQEKQRIAWSNKFTSALQSLVDRGEVSQQGSKDALKEVLNTVSKEAAVEAPQSRVTDDGILAFKDHPNLAELEVFGCDVSRSVYEEVLRSLGLNADVIAAAIQSRFDFESKKAFLFIPSTQLPDSSNKTQIIVSNSIPFDLSRLQYILPDDSLYEVVLKGAATNELPTLFNCQNVKSLTIHTPDMLWWRPASRDVSKMVWLESLTIEGAVDDLELLVDMKALRELNLSDASALTRDDIAALESLPNLEILRLRLATTTAEIRELLDGSDLLIEEFVSRTK